MMPRVWTHLSWVSDFADFFSSDSCFVDTGAGSPGGVFEGDDHRRGSRGFRFVFQNRRILLAGQGLLVLAGVFFLQGGEARGGAIDLAGEADLIAVHVGEEEALVRHVGEGDSGADWLVEGAEFLGEGGGVAIHPEVDGGGFGLPGAAEAPLGGDDFVHEEALEGADGFPEGEVLGLVLAVLLVVLIAEDEDAGVHAMGDGAARSMACVAPFPAGVVCLASVRVGVGVVSVGGCFVSC